MICSRLTKFSRKKLQKLLLFWNKKTMRKNLERNPILRKQQSQRKRFPTLQQSNRINLAVKLWTTPVGINEKGFVNSDFGMFLLLDYCIENERGSVGTPLCRVLINISSKSSKIVYFSQNCYFHVM